MAVQAVAGGRHSQLCRGNVPPDVPMRTPALGQGPPRIAGGLTSLARSWPHLFAKETLLTEPSLTTPFSSPSKAEPGFCRGVGGELPAGVNLQPCSGTTLTQTITNHLAETRQPNG